MDLLTTEETAKYTKMPAATLRYWRHVGAGPRSFKLGARRVMYKREDVDRWLQEQYDAGRDDKVGA